MTSFVDDPDVVTVIVEEPEVQVVTLPGEPDSVVALIEGLPGPQGIQGIQGIQGDKGDKGDPGVGIVGVQTPLILNPDTGIMSIDGSVFDPAGAADVSLDQAKAYADMQIANARYTYTQSSASNNWVVTHNLGKKPSVTVSDSANNQVFGDIFYVSNNVLEIHFGSAVSGTAYLI